MLWLVSEACQTYMSVWVTFKWLYPLDKQTDDCISPHDTLMSLAMDLAALCDMYVEVKMAPMDAIWLFLVKT